MEKDYLKNLQEAVEITNSFKLSVDQQEIINYLLDNRNEINTFLKEGADCKETIFDLMKLAEGDNVIISCFFIRKTVNIFISFTSNEGNKILILNTLDNPLQYEEEALKRAFISYFGQGLVKPETVYEIFKESLLAYSVIRLKQI